MSHKRSLWKGAGRGWRRCYPAKPKAMRDGIQLSEAITGDGAAIFRHACGLGLEGIVSKRIGSRYVSGRTRLVEDEEPEFRTAVSRASFALVLVVVINVSTPKTVTTA